MKLKSKICIIGIIILFIFVFSENTSAYSAEIDRIKKSSQEEQRQKKEV